MFDYVVILKMTEVNFEYKKNGSEQSQINFLRLVTPEPFLVLYKTVFIRFHKRTML